MKKIFALALIFSTSIALTAQDKNFQLGFQLSPNLSWISPDSEGIESDGMKLGFSYGIVADFRIAENYAFSTGFTLLNAGGKINYPNVVSITTTVNGAASSQEIGGRSTADVRMQYIQIPLTIKLKTNEIGYMKYFGQFGVGTAFNIDATADTEFRYSDPSGSAVTISEDDVDFADQISLFRASLLMGIGAEYNLSGNTSLMFGITFDNGFLNILSEDGYAEDGTGFAKTDNNGNFNKNEDFKAINNSIILNVGVLF